MIFDSWQIEEFFEEKIIWTKKIAKLVKRRAKKKILFDHRNNQKIARDFGVSYKQRVQFSSKEKSKPHLSKFLFHEKQ